MGETVKWEDLVKADGVYHKPFNQMPFTGDVTGVYQGYLKNGKKDGPWSDFWDGGTIANKRIYKEGVLINHTIYRVNGNVEVKKHYKRSLNRLNLDGPYEEYWSNGQLKSKGVFKNGNQHGVWAEFYEDGSVDKKGTGTYKNGKKVYD